MSKIICDICGTTYQSSADSCPICGFSNEAADRSRDDMLFEESQEESRARAGRFTPAGRKKEIFNYDEVNAEADEDEYEEEYEEQYEEEYEDDEDSDDEDYDDEEEEEDAPRHNTFVVILLTILIVVLLGAAAFIFFRFFLPSMREEAPVETTAAVVETEAPATTELTIPCEQMAMTNAGVAELSAEGQQFLLHIKALPENTTDEIIYTSGNESIATVTADGKITAVSEGETVIYISCGRHSIECPVIVKYVEETVPPTTEETVPETAPEETTEETAEVTTPPSNVTLKLKKTDIQLGVYYEFQLLLDCELSPTDVTWTSEHPHIAKVDDQGNVTALKEGTTSIIVKYGDQTVSCMVRCGWF